MTFIEVDRAAEGGLHEDILEGRPRNGEETSVITPGGFQPVVREVADLECNGLRYVGGQLRARHTTELDQVQLES